MWSKSIIFIASFFCSCHILNADIFYDNRLVPVSPPENFLDSYSDLLINVPPPDFYTTDILINESPYHLEILGWRSSYNAGGVILIPNKLNGRKTAVLVLGPWGIGDGQGVRIPEPHGVCFDIEKWSNIYHDHVKYQLTPFIRKLRNHVKVIGFSLPGGADPYRTKIYGSHPNEAQDTKQSLYQLYRNHHFHGYPISETLILNSMPVVTDYFAKFLPIYSSSYFNGSGFWELPIPMHKDMEWRKEDLFFWTAEGYNKARNILKKQGITNIILCGYHMGACLKDSSLGYDNLKKDFNVFIVGDASLSCSHGSMYTPLITLVDTISASKENLITQMSWVKPVQILKTGTSQSLLEEDY